MLLIVTGILFVLCIIGIIYHGVCAWESFVTLPRIEREERERFDKQYALHITTDDLDEVAARLASDQAWRERVRRLNKYADWLAESNPICNIVEASYRKALNKQ